jgi:hypothetical protein
MPGAYFNGSETACGGSTGNKGLTRAVSGEAISFEPPAAKIKGWARIVLPQWQWDVGRGSDLLKHLIPGCAGERCRSPRLIGETALATHPGVQGAGMLHNPRQHRQRLTFSLGFVHAAICATCSGE